MKFPPPQLAYFLQEPTNRRNVLLLFKLLLVLVGIVAVYSILFHLLMMREDRDYTWVTGIYWTLTVMSTLGFGDITFEGDLGRAFSICVLITGTVYLLVLLPFTFIQFFYAPWAESQTAARTPRELPPETIGHVVLTHYDLVTHTLIQKLIQYHYPYVLLVSDTAEALRLSDQNIKTVVGDLDDPGTYEKVRADRAALIATTATDMVNTNVVFTVRGLTRRVQITATATDSASLDIMRLAGCNNVLRLGQMLGQSLARRANGGDVVAHVIGQFDQLLIAEATATGTPMVGQTLEQIGLRKKVGITVVGVWEQGHFETARPDTHVSANTVLVLAATREQLEKYDELFLIYHASKAPVVIIGGGRVGRSTGRALAERGLDYRIVEQLPERIPDPEKYVLGNAAELEILNKAGIMDTPTVIITSHEDDTNVYLTIFCRHLRPDIQIISRANLERNISTLHRAGADFVMSYASMGANTIFNLLERSNTLMVAEGLDVFKVKMPVALTGQTIAGSSIRRETGCTVIALDIDHTVQVNPDPFQSLPAEAEIILIGSVDAEKRFLEVYGD